MTTQTEALKLALEALDQLTNAADTFSVSGVYFNEEVWAKKCLSDAYFAITTIEEALAKPEQEPVGMVKDLFTNAAWDKLDVLGSTKVYLSTPPQRKPLTDEQVREIANQYALSLAFPYDSPTTPEMFARAIEAAHGIKE